MLASPSSGNVQKEECSNKNQLLVSGGWGCVCAPLGVNSRIKHHKCGLMFLHLDPIQRDRQLQLQLYTSYSSSTCTAHFRQAFKNERDQIYHRIIERYRQDILYFNLLLETRRASRLYQVTQSNLKLSKDGDSPPHWSISQYCSTTLGKHFKKTKS